MTAYSFSAGQLIAVFSIVILSAVNYFVIKSGVTVQNIFTFLRIGAVASLIFLGLALIAVLWTYDGWYGINCTAKEIKNPERNIPLGLILGTLSVTFFYMLINLILFYFIRYIKSEIENSACLFLTCRTTCNLSPIDHEGLPDDKAGII